MFLHCLVTQNKTFNAGQQWNWLLTFGIIKDVNHDDKTCRTQPNNPITAPIVQNKISSDFITELDIQLCELFHILSIPVLTSTVTKSDPGTFFIHTYKNAIEKGMIQSSSHARSYFLSTDNSPEDTRSNGVAHAIISKEWNIFHKQRLPNPMNIFKLTNRVLE